MPKLEVWPKLDLLIILTLISSPYLLSFILCSNQEVSTLVLSKNHWRQITSVPSSSVYFHFPILTFLSSFSCSLRTLSKSSISLCLKKTILLRLAVSPFCMAKCTPSSLKVIQEFNTSRHWQFPNSLRYSKQAMAIAWYGMMWFGMAWYGMVWYGIVEYSSVSI